MTELTYTNRVMKWTPANYSEFFILSRIKDEFPFCVILEPGDGTRYDLIIMPAQPVNAVIHFDLDTAKSAFLVTRVTGGDPRGVAVVAPGYTHQIFALANGNKWTQEFLTWWFETLFEKLNA